MITSPVGTTTRLSFLLLTVHSTLPLQAIGVFTLTTAIFGLEMLAHPAAVVNAATAARVVSFFMWQGLLPFANRSGPSAAPGRGPGWNPKPALSVSHGFQAAFSVRG